ncbi:MAG: hypothetical protein ACI4HQ_03635 [Acetatifactor sp.]
MSERLTVLYGERQICALELTDSKGQYDEEMRRILRLASQEGELICPDCRQRMILCAGAVVPPYFRHYELQNCEYSMTLQTRAGKRTYLCRQALYQFVKDSGFPNPVQEEKSGGGLSPVLFDTGAGKAGYVYLDGKTRNYRELLEGYRSYREQGIRLFFFLNIRFRSKAQNITSDEAECARLNGGEIYYLDEEQKRVTIRRKYTDESGNRRDFEAVYDLKELCPESDGKITGRFLEQFCMLRKEEKKKVWKVLRVPAEDGLDEVYEDFDFILMDALEEIWVLPFFAFQTGEVQRHRTNRLSFLESQNEELRRMEEEKREDYAQSLVSYILKKRNSWEFEAIP